jgi:hypothetical protein
VIFIEAPVFTHLLPGYLTDDEYRLLQRALLTRPDVGAVMPGTGGFRKMRWIDSRRGKGTRGGLRVIYYHFVEDAQIWLMTLYGKDEIDDLRPSEKSILKKAIDAERRARRGLTARITEDEVT